MMLPKKSPEPTAVGACLPPRQRKIMLSPQRRPSLPAFNSLVVMAVDSMLRRATGRKLESTAITTRHLSGRSVRMLAFGLAFRP